MALLGMRRKKKGARPKPRALEERFAALGIDAERVRKDMADGMSMIEAVAAQVGIPAEMLEEAVLKSVRERRGQHD